MSEWMYDEDLGPDDLEFLSRWSSMGQATEHETDKASAEAMEGAQTAEGEGDYEDEEGPESDSEGAEGYEMDEDRDEDGEGYGEPQSASESANVDESKMNLSHLETGEDDPSNIQEDESDLEYDDLDYEGDEDDLGDYSDAEDDELDTEDDDNFTDAQVEEDDGEGERGNSDEARESDEPMSAEVHEETADQERAIPEDESDQQERVAELDEPDLDERQESDDPEIRKSELSGDRDERQDNDNDVESEDESNEGEFETHNFGNLPERRPGCTNHCEDNPHDPNDSDAEECACCAERIERERELWGAIATDMHGNDVFPGDKLVVSVPMSMIVTGSIVTANVPNTEIDPQRIAESLKGVTDEEKMWLSAPGKVSQFTGWHMQGDGPIWTFSKDKQLTFAEKVGEIHRKPSEPKSEEEIEDMAARFKDELDQIPETSEGNNEPQTEEAEDDESEASSDDEMEDDRDDEKSDDDDSERDAADKGSSDSNGEANEHGSQKERNALTALRDAVWNFMDNGGDQYGVYSTIDFAIQTWTNKKDKS